MHLNKVSVIIALIILAINIFLLMVYFQKQGQFTFKFIKGIYEETKAEQDRGEVQMSRLDFSLTYVIF